uniref:ABC-type xenobiotic transporter n=1 Tax=Brachionus rotundiformis TaxID=96890 RepID=A0A7H9SKY4_9BILA|nr:ATP-binding cassette transporter subfamily C member 10 [Brachionus rotundiformis]
MFCLNESIIDPSKPEYLNQCYISLYLVSPCYLLLSVANAYSCGSRGNFGRKRVFPSLKSVRFVSFVLLSISLADTFTNYFMPFGNKQPTKAESLIPHSYKLSALFIHTFTIFNKNLFIPRFPIKLLVSWLLVLFANCIDFINTFQRMKDFGNQSLNEKCNLILLANFIFFLLVYLIFILSSFRNKVEGFIYLYDDINEWQEDNASYHSYLTFGWLEAVMKKGYQRGIKSVDDLSKLPKYLNTRLINLSFMSRYNNADEYLKNPIVEPGLLQNENFMQTHLNYEDVCFDQQNLLPKSKLVKTLVKNFGKEFLFLGFLRLVNDLLGFSGPILLNQLVQFVQVKESQLKTGIYYAMALFVSTLLSSLINIHFTNLLNQFCLRVRSALTSLIYRKAVVIKLNQMNKYSIGQVVNFMSIDTDSVVNAFPSFHSCWSLPFQLVITLYLLYIQIGPSFLVGLIFVIILIPINKFLSDFIGKVQVKMMNFKDERVKLMTEFLDGIRVIKFCAWEAYFLRRIKKVREQELGELRAKKYLDAGCVYFWASTPILMSVFTFSTYVWLGNVLTPAKVFTSLALFNMLIMPLNNFPWVVNGLVQSLVSIRRLEKFLNAENLHWTKYYSFNELGASDQVLVDVHAGQFNWEKTEATDDGNGLNDISFKVNKGDFIGVIGKVGSGKTSILLTLMAELEKNNGKLRINSQTCEQGFAYVGQEVWIQQGTIRENILFGSEMNVEFYKKVLNACCLETDLENLPYGDETPVGENGICLSGGQKARVTLARACYNRKMEIYLLDDPLSAVDAHVCRHLVNKCLNGLLKNKTRILCTHQIEHLINADMVLVIDEGKIVDSGKGCDLIPKIMKIEKASFSNEDNTQLSVESDGIDWMQKLTDEEMRKKEEEEKEHGVINYQVWKYYCVSVGVLLTSLTIIFLALMQTSRNLTDYWLSYWTQNHDLNSLFGLRNQTYVLNAEKVHFYTPNGFFSGKSYQQHEQTTQFFVVYGVLGMANTLFTLIRAFLFAYSGISAGRFVHEALIQNLVKASVQFFDNTPKGQILNRLSTDMYAIDDSLPFILNIFLANIFGLVGILTITCLSLPWFSLALIPLSLIYYSIQNYYRWTSRELKRLSSVSLSPLYTHFHETIRGLVTIRAFRKVKKYCKQNEEHLNKFIRASYNSQAAAQWLSFRLQMISVAMITIVGLTAVVQHIYGTSNASLVGLALSYILSVTGLLNGLITSFSETEKEMVSVERAYQFRNLDSENWQGVEQVAETWPDQAKIEFKNVNLRYTGWSPLALNNVSFVINHGEKIGICGRTGSGKSSLLMALFRGCEINSGRIVIDSKNIQNLNLNDLRQKLSIIPQDPFLFEATLRENLDPFGQISDDEMWDVLQETGLDGKFGKNVAILDTMIEERGKNLSSGERQLICLLRAILTKRKIICIDEATAQVDLETDNLIQKVIRSKFKDTTVLTIAHRIQTIFDYDRILVMDGGKVAEFDSVQNLINNKNSLFYSLVNESLNLKK